MKTVIKISLLMLLLLANKVYGQAYTIAANNCYKEKDYQCAQTQIDSAIITNERFNSQTWQLRGLIYKKLETPENLEPREIAIESFVQARNVDSAKVYEEKITSLLHNTIIRYYNDAVVYLENNDLNASEKSYSKYITSYKKYVNAQQDFTASDIEYYNALGAKCLKTASIKEGEEKEKLINKGIECYLIVLEKDSTQFQSNFNLGVTYYNKGADIAVNIDPLTPIEEIPAIEAKVQDYFSKALPYLLRAREIEPDRLDVIEAITGCYYGLLDNENYLKHQTLLDEKNLPKLLERVDKNPKDREALESLVRIYDTTLKDKDKFIKYNKMLENLEMEE
ncbi:hypothetical protein K6119_12425 [Paracrocinitomix mangrovi]|uniref:hypothetical protein n=1 Tax=Paracrocinitomix mangrovi TaxID=2862509 RepID=UPI001C8ED1AB|nr:hypothetical protein [Paracrocinitomix mangrovi]UKN00538.1 hypothetical protein K6119_12425 [Paracrocinitomix mangrovi]